MNEQIARHFGQPSRCPYCGALDIEGRSVVIGGDLATQGLRCVQCGRAWSDVYRLEMILDDNGQEHRRRAELRTPLSNPVPNRDARQREIVPPEALAKCKVSVVGVGAIGRQVALQAAAIGVPWLQLIDPDIVEPVNLACQGYLEDDLGRPKVEATADLAQQINHQLEVHEVQSRFRRSLPGAGVGNVLFCCVDSIQTRQRIWEAVRERVEFFCDGRMYGEVIRILTATDPTSRQHYPTTLFAEDEAFRGDGHCATPSTIFTANIAAGLMLHQFSRHLRHLPLDPDLTLNLLASEFSCR